ncbi:hypothetical protein ASG47_19745 [Devosia sp. Leaf420]|uniref:hypothetical protein n=1 Tax=Devosia sp. Leaf420 TaxID=1736374 RepID=UPI000714716B|nr:hypothetical protein [Devosia sp. Leaf420]KQT50339.1 hypothetical protein ASG47_19745 [Devosia sp. Leaf420]
MTVYRERAAIRFDLPSGQFGFVAGVRGNIVWDGVTFIGSGALIEVENPGETINLAAVDLTLTLASHRRINNTWHQLFEPSLLNSIEDEVWFRRPAIVYRFKFDANRRLTSVDQLLRREIYKIEHLRSKRGRTIKATLSSPAALAKVVEAKTRGAELQRLIDPNDRGYDHIARVSTDPIVWGPQNGPVQANTGRGPSSGGR